MAAGSLTVIGTIAGLPVGSQSIGANTVSSVAANGEVLALVLANGDNTITPPALPVCTAVLIQFPATSATTKKLKGVGGDTGITVGPTGLVLFSFPAAPAAFIINSSAVDTGLITYITFL